jgi:hypothetical protein
LTLRDHSARSLYFGTSFIDIDSIAICNLPKRQELIMDGSEVLLLEHNNAADELSTL